MRPAFFALAIGTLALAAAIPAACAAPGSAAGTESAQGEVSWTIEADADQRAKQKVQFGLTRRTANSRWMHSTTRPLAGLTGLTAGQLASETGTPVSFRLDRDAGAIVCSGFARRWRGTGDCSFQANPGFAEALAERGYGRPSEGELFSLALHDLGFAYVEELKRQGYSRPTVADLVRAGDHGAGLDYLKGMGGRGYRVGSLAALISMRDHGVTADYVSELARLGIGDLSAAEVVRLRDHGVTPGFVGAFRAAGYPLTLDQLVRLRDHGVTPDYVQQLARYGVRNVPADQLVRLRDHGVSPEFVGEAAAAGLSLPNRPADPPARPRSDLRLSA
jgi:hypothetical protein